jgi:hypothetical protein
MKPMTQDVTPWLLEIKTLKQQLADAQVALDQAYASADNWQKLYDIEASQRRADAAVAQQQLAEVRAELAVQIADTRVLKAQELPQQIAGLDVESLRQQLVTAMAQQEQLAADLAAEKQEHGQTRENLMMALGDAMGVIAKYRLQSQSGLEPGAESEVQHDPLL